VLVSDNLPFVSTYQTGFAALADPTRREVFERIAAHPTSVGELAAELPVSRPAVSQHLKALKDAGLVSDTARGTRRVYRINPEGVAMLRDYLDLFWRRSLTNFKTVTEETFHDRDNQHN
jgi:DNA-binding transcriptional ArsR family regulator